MSEAKPKVVKMDTGYHQSAMQTLCEAIDRASANKWDGVVVLGYSRVGKQGYVEVKASEFLSTDQVIGAIERAKFEIFTKGE